MLATGNEDSLNLTRIQLTPDGAGTVGSEEALSTGHLRDRFPAISPDGRNIVVSTNRIGDEGLWMVAVGSKQWTRVELPADATAKINEACWAPSGQELVVKRFLRDGNASMWRVAVDGSTAEPLTGPEPTIGGTFPCAFSSDGRKFVYSRIVEGFSQVYMFDMTTRSARQLTLSRSNKNQATWSPDGKWVAFSNNTKGATQVARMPSAGGKEELLTSGFERKLHFFYSPDGRWLYVQPSHRNIYRMPANGGPLQPVTRFTEPNLFLEEPTIAPDGSYLAYNRSSGGSSLWLLTIGERAY